MDEIPTVYIAEDHTALRSMLSSYLGSSRRFHVVGQTSDGRQVLEDCRRLQPRVIILDLALPGLHGIEVARALRAELPHLSVLVFSSREDTASVRQVIEAGAKGMVEKTAPIEVLKKAIDAVAAGKPFFGPAITQALSRAFVDPLTTNSDDLLTNREREVLQLIAEGCSSDVISSRLEISCYTAESHRRNIMRKLDAHNTADLTREAIRLKLVREG